VRRFTLITLIVLLALLVGAGAYQVVLATRDQEPFPGPAPGTPLPSVSVTP